MQIRVLNFLLIVLLVISCEPIYRQDTLKNILNSETLRVGVTSDYAPHSYKDKFGNYQGSEIQNAKLLAKTLGVQLKLIPTSYTTLVNDMQNNKYDIAMCGLNATKYRRKYGYFSIPYTLVPKSFVCRCDRINEFDKENLKSIDKASLSILVGENTSELDHLEQKLKFASLETSTNPNIEFVTAKFKTNSIDLFYIDNTFAEELSKKDNSLCYFNLKQSSYKGGFSFYIPKDAIWKKYINNWIINSGEQLN